jgi:hypothetical protein
VRSTALCLIMARLGSSSMRSTSAVALPA